MFPDFLRRKKKRVSPQEENPETPADNAFRLRTELIESIIKALKPIRYSQRKIHSLILHIYDCENALAFNAIAHSPEFENALRLELDNSGIAEAVNAQWSCSSAPPPPYSSRIGTGLFLDARYINESSGKRARITAVRGELLNEPVILEPTDEEQFNIGRGEFPRLDTGIFHRNQIILTESDEPTEDSLNKYVSRAHAAILFYPAKGFALKVYPGGCFLTDNRTRILREDTVIDVTNTALKYPLKHKDQLELGKNVVLLFEII